MDTPVLVHVLALRMECSGTLELFEEWLLAQSALAKANLRVSQAARGHDLDVTACQGSFPVCSLQAAALRGFRLNRFGQRMPIGLGARRLAQPLWSLLIALTSAAGISCEF